MPIFHCLRLIVLFKKNFGRTSSHPPGFRRRTICTYLESGTCSPSAIDFPVEDCHGQQGAGQPSDVRFQFSGIVGSGKCPAEITSRVSDVGSHREPTLLFFVIQCLQKSLPSKEAWRWRQSTNRPSQRQEPLPEVWKEEGNPFSQAPPVRDSLRAMRHPFPEC